MSVILQKLNFEGVKEYWIVFPTDKIIQVFKINNEKMYGKPEVYSEGEKIKTPILEGLEIDLDLVFKE